MHLCHAYGCNQPVPPKMFMCKSHWFALPVLLRNAIWREYSPGQERRKDPTARYMAVQRLAVAHQLQLRIRGGGPETADELIVAHAELMTSAREWRQRAIELKQGDPFVGLESLV